MLIDDIEALTAWLIKELKPISDAEPPVLAKYVISLIRKPDKTDEEIKEFCTAQLEVFLQANTKRFVDKMFVALKEDSYIEDKSKEEKKEPIEKVIPSKEEKRIEEPKATSSRDLKQPEIKKTPVLRKEEQLKKEEVKVPRRRISPPPGEKKDITRDRDNRRRSRSPRNRRERRRTPDRRHRRSRSRSRSGEREHVKEEEGRKKRRCRDYDEQGYCRKGEMCQYDHGPDAVIFDREAMDMMIKPPNLSVPPPGYNPINPPPPGVENLYSVPPIAGQPNVEGYNPEAPALTSANYSVPPPVLPLQMSQAPYRPTAYTVNAAQLSNVPVYDPNSGVPVDPTSGPPTGHAMRGSNRGRGRGRISHSAPHRSIGDGKTIQVSRIPQEQNNITKLNEHFSQFGNIVNIQVRFDGDPECALITYTCKAEASAALKSPSPVLNNRFIRVSFYRPVDSESSSAGGESTTNLSSGVRVTKPTAAIVAEKKVASVGESKFVNITFTAKEKAKAKKKDLQNKAKSLLAAHKKQLALLDSLFKQQKTILGKLREDGTDVEAKKRLKELAKSTSEQIKVATTLSNSLSRQMKENSEALKQAESQLEELGNAASPVVEKDENGTATRKRTAPVAESSPIKKKTLGAAVLVTGFTLEEEQKVTEAMEAIGELIDVEIQPGGAVYIYKNADDAEKALVNPPNIEGKILGLSLDTKMDKERLTPKELMYE